MFPGFTRTAVIVMLAASLAAASARQGGSAAVPIDRDDIGGVVASANGPEAGVWVIAETTALPTKFVRIVVTDDRGRYVLPDLPRANYSVWVRGYGLVDSPKVQAMPGKPLNLTATLAPSAKAAAQYYPANYWYALLQPPPTRDFPGTGRAGNGIPETLKTQAMWIGNIKQTNACTQCHQMGTKATREFPSNFPRFANSVQAWDYRVQVGVSGAFMNSTMAPLGRNRAMRVFADWTDRIATGELPQAPPRPAGLERNVVVTMWDWASEKLFTHDEIATDKRHPTVNASGAVVGVTELSGDYIVALDPAKHTVKIVAVPTHDPKAPFSWGQDVPQPSPYWGQEVLWKGQVSPHNPMFDQKGRVWITARGGCRLYDPTTDRVTHIPECPGGHHLQIDANDVLWFDAAEPAYFDIRLYDRGKAKEAGGRIPIVFDHNANGKLDAGWTTASQPPVARKDRQMNLGQAYAIMPSPVDGSLWQSYVGIPGSIVRIDPTTKLSEVYEPPFMNAKAKVEGYEPHGVDVDTNGVVWTGLTGSGHLASFDRRKCAAPLNGPAATGQHCVEGWTLWTAPGPNFKGVTESGSADSFYLNWSDQHDTSGLGRNTQFLTGSGSDSLLALVDGTWVVLRVPYPMGFHPRGMDGRIDNPKGGWKGRGLWSAYSAQTPWHIEGGKGTKPKVVNFQIRPHPLAR